MPYIPCALCAWMCAGTFGACGGLHGKQNSVPSLGQCRPGAVYGVYVHESGAVCAAAAGTLTQQSAAIQESAISHGGAWPENLYITYQRSRFVWCFAAMHCRRAQSIRGFLGDHNRLHTPFIWKIDDDDDDEKKKTEREKERNERIAFGCIFVYKRASQRAYGRKRSGYWTAQYERVEIPFREERLTTQQQRHRSEHFLTELRARLRCAGKSEKQSKEKFCRTSRL